MNSLAVQAQENERVRTEQALHSLSGGGLGRKPKLAISVLLLQ